MAPEHGCGQNGGVSAVLLTPPKMEWYCPNCSARRVTKARINPGDSVSEIHICPGLKGVWAPLVPVGVKAKVTANLREDYVGPLDIPQRNDEGQVIMSVTAERDEGTDLVVLAPTAVYKLG